MASFKKILVIRLSSFGDIILSFPLLNKLKEKFPEAEISFLTKQEYEPLIKMNHNVDNFILYENSRDDIRKNVREGNFDLILDIHKNQRTFYVTRDVKKHTRRYYKENLKKFFLVKLKRNHFKEILPVYKKYLLTIKDFLNEKDYSFTSTELNFPKEKKIEGDYIVISPAAKHFTKTYPKEKFVELIQRNPEKNFILTGSNSLTDMEICSFIEKKCSNVSNFCGKLNYYELANVIHNSEYVICNDSGVLHFSEALGKKVIAVFGSTVKEFGFFPQLSESEVFENKSLSCRPCTHIGRSACPLNHFLCMNDVEIKIN